MIWWVFNDAGGVHTQSNGQAMHVEVHTTSFAYASDDDLNNTTFQSYQVINRSSQDIDSCFFSLFIDSDLGCPYDDYLGCDFSLDAQGNQRRMMYVYNADDLDGAKDGSCKGNIATYGSDIPMIGFDIIELPYNATNTTFMYFGRGELYDPPPAMTDPNQVSDFYHFMNAIWKDGTPLSIGGPGYTQNPDPKNITKYAFLDEPKNKNGWSMYNSNLGTKNVDYSGLLSVGAFRLFPGGIGQVTYSIPWVSSQGGGAVDLTSLRRAASRARELFDGCFHLFGPSAPNVNTVGLDKACVINLESIGQPSFLFEDSYQQQPLLMPTNFANERYKFEGYKIYQVISDTVSIINIENKPNVAKLVAQTDIANGITKSYNWKAKKNPNNPSFPNFIKEEKVNGNDLGLKRSFYFSHDAFAPSGNNGLVNGKKYFYLVLPYAYNNYQEFNPLTGNGQQTQYIAGLDNVFIYQVTPENNPLSSQYGVELPITRFDGVGTGGNILDMSDDMYNIIFSKTFDGKITYKAGKSPINIKVVNPQKLQDGEYTLRLIDDDMSNSTIENNAKWQLFKNGIQAITSAKTIHQINEQIVDELGIAISVRTLLHSF